MKANKVRPEMDHPRDGASFVSRLFFWYMIPLFTKGVKKNLQPEDMYEVPKNYEATLLLESMTKKLEKSKNKKFALLNLLWKSHGPSYVAICFAKFFCKTFIIFFQPFAYSKIIAFFVPRQTSISTTYIYSLSVALVLSKFLYAVFEQNTSLWLTVLGTKLKAGLYALIYEKLMKIDYLKHPEMGRIITLLTKDIQTLAYFLLEGAFLLESLITTVIMCVILYVKIGLPTLPLILAVLFMFPVHGYIIYKMKQFEKRMCENAEMRYKVLKETFQYIRLIKMLVWESFFEKRIRYYRKNEISSMYKIIFLTNFALLATLAILNISLYSLLIFYMNLDPHLTAGTVFFLINCYRILYDNFSIRMVVAYTELGKLLACMRRIENTLLAMEIKRTYPLKNMSASIEANQLTILTNQKNILQNINFKIENPSMVILRGPSSCGKTVLLKTLIGEYYTSGSLNIKGEISYASQEPWLFPGTIRQNILFGEDFNESRYLKVLEACALSYDVERMQDGDSTIVEDGGLNLSKGQCARINLARAVYRKADIYLIDDCFSSLDSEMLSEIFKECFCKFLKGRILFIVSQMQLELVHFDQVYTFQDNTLIIENLKQTSSSKEIFSKYHEPHWQIENDSTAHSLPSEDSPLLSQHLKKEVIYKEKNQKGGVKKSVYLKFLLHGGNYFQYALLLLATACTQIVISYHNILLPKWADFREQFINKVARNDTRFEQYEKEANHKFMNCIYVILLVTTLGAIRYLMIWLFGRKAVINLHGNALNVLYFPITFFEERRIGNILNKFSKDFTIIDERLFEAWLNALITVPMVIGVFVMVVYVKPSLLIFCIICLICLTTIQLIYLKTSTNLRRIDSLTRAPVIGSIKSTFEGITTIRAAQNQLKLIGQFHTYLNIFTSTTYTLQCASRAFWFALNLCSTIFTAALLIKFFIFDEGASTAGDVGFVLMEASFLQIFLTIALHFTAQIENLMTSVERVLEYTEDRNENQVGVEMHDHWPEAGSVNCKNVILKYSTSKNLVLNNFNLSVEAGEKVLIVGRTGVGKSSIFSILYRLYDFEGIITIDDVDIKTISLKYLRSKLSIVSQDTVLFSGSIRDNVDPGKQCSDEELWHIIKLLKLTNCVMSLDDTIDENDDQFSCGEKQLLSLARTMTQKNKILLLDEPFSRLDAPSVELIEQILVKHFMDHTVMMISHTRPSIWKFDKIVKLQ